MGALQPEKYSCYGAHVNLVACSMVMADWHESGYKPEYTYPALKQRQRLALLTSQPWARMLAQRQRLS